MQQLVKDAQALKSAKQGRSSSSGSSGSDSGSGSSSDSSKSSKSPAVVPVKADTNTKRIPPIIEKKMQLRNQLDMYQVDEEFEEEKYTITGKTATDVVLPNIRETRIGQQSRVAQQSTMQKRQLPTVAQNPLLTSMGVQSSKGVPSYKVQKTSVMSNRDSINKNFAFENSITPRMSTMVNEPEPVTSEFQPAFESKMEIKEPENQDDKRPPKMDGNIGSTSFFLKALEEEQEIQNRREDKKAQIEALQAELDSPEPVVNNRNGVKLAPLNENKIQTEENRLENEKARQRSVLNSLTYELMNPVCLVQKGKLMRSQARADQKRSLHASRNSQIRQMPVAMHATMHQFNPLEMQLSDFGITDVSMNGHSRKGNRKSSIAPISRKFATPQRQKPVMVEDQRDEQDIRLSFLEKKLVERSRFRTLERTLKQVSHRQSVQQQIPESPAIAGRLTRRFNPFETAGQTMFSQRSVSVQPYPENYQAADVTLMSSPFVSGTMKKHKHKKSKRR